MKQMKESKDRLQYGSQDPISHLKVRTDLQGGASEESCENNLAYWKKQYYKWYDKAARKHGL